MKKKPECQRCGACCMTADIDLGAITEENEASKMDRLLWLSLHRCDTGVMVRDDGKKHAMVRIPITCSKLILVENGKYACKIHDSDKRPKLCREFLCPRVAQGTPTNKVELASPPQG